MEWATKLMEYFSRKFVLAIAALIGSFVLLWYNKPMGEWAMVIAVILGFYNGANVAQDMVMMKKVKNHDEAVQNLVALDHKPSD